MEIEDWPNLVAMFQARVAKYGDGPFLWEKRGGKYRPTSWRDAWNQAMALAASLQEAGVKPGDRVLLLSQNTPRWVIADFAIMAAGGVTVPVYTTNSVANHKHILTDSDAETAIVSTAALAQPFLEAATGNGRLKRLVMMEDADQLEPAGIDIRSWDDTIRAGQDGASAIADAAALIDRDDPAAIIYTSGTGGNPRGVILSHRAIIANCVGATDVLAAVGLDDEVFLSFLPLSHAYEHSAGMMFPVSIGAQIYFAERVDTLSTNLPEARPTIMTAVPRLYEILRERIIKGVAREGGFKAQLFRKTVELGGRRIENGGTLGLWDSAIDAVLERLVRDRFRARFGGRLKAFVSGGAPLNYEVGVFFSALGLQLLQGYGQTEAGPVISVNRVEHNKLRTVGPPLKGVEVRIADDGEILVRGPLLMDGYWNAPEDSAAALRDGWLYSGDIGVIDEDGYLQITDRKKDIIVNSAGETLSPQRIEMNLALEPEIEVAMAVGNQRPHVVAVVVPAQEFVSTFARQNRVEADLTTLAGDKAFRSAIGEVIDRANSNFSATERIKRFIVADEPFTIENGMMTPTMKLRRHEILKRWGDAVDQLYDGPATSKT